MKFFFSWSCERASYLIGEKYYKKDVDTPSKRARTSFICTFQAIGFGTIVNSVYNIDHLEVFRFGVNPGRPHRIHFFGNLDRHLVLKVS